MVKNSFENGTLQIQGDDGEWQDIGLVKNLQFPHSEQTARDMASIAQPFQDMVTALKDAMKSFTITFSLSAENSRYWARQFKKARNRARYFRRYNNIGRKAGKR